MIKKTNYAILGILTLGPQSGYDIKKFISESIGYFWQESYGQLYPTLKNLVDQGMAEMHLVRTKEGRPDKKVYSITDRGRRELIDWLTRPVEKMPVLRNEVLLKLFFGYEVDDQVSEKLIENVKKIAVENKMQMQTIYKMIESQYQSHPGGRFWKITVLAGIHNFDSMIKWADDSIKILNGEQP
jgi:DNA-binding PadR family transcriptional regulator